MRVLVTGSAGFIGLHVQAELRERGHHPVLFDEPGTQDVRWPGPVIDAVRDVDAVINLAGRLGTTELLGSETEAARVNVIGALNVYDAAADRGLPVVQIGTGHKGQPNAYAITKACAEDLGLARAQWLGDKITVVRAFHVYGEGQKPGPPHGKAPVWKFFPTFACRAITRMPLELNGGGQQVIDPVHVSEVARVLVDAIDGPYGEIIEAGCGSPVTVRQVAEDIRECSGNVKLPIVEAADRPGEPHDAVVLAMKPACQNSWPWRVAETVTWYHELILAGQR